MNTQNKSHAVMAHRHEPRESFDDFPTPPWATRALIEYVLGTKDIENSTCREPACGRGYMAMTLKEYFGDVYSSDIIDYGYGDNIDFLSSKVFDKTDWIITNPPFKLAEEFIVRGLKIANRGVAVLVRTVFLEGIGRYERLFSLHPPSVVAQFVERVPIIKGRIDPKATTATGYAWLVWDKIISKPTEITWIPPCRKKLELKADYSFSNEDFLSVIRNRRVLKLTE